MTHVPPITEADVRAMASEQSFERGYRYYRDEFVFDVVHRGDLITAKVEGSEYEPYRVAVVVGDANIVEISCTCPYDWGGICKHIVATLLVVIHQPETIVEKPVLATMLADLTADQLRQVLIGVAETGPGFAEVIEQEVTWLRDQPTTQTGTASAPAPVSLAAIRREMHKDFLLTGKDVPFQYGYYDEFAALEVDPDEILRPHLELLTALLDGGDVTTVAALITTIIESFIDGLTDLDEWVYEYNMDLFDEANLSLGTALAEVLLSLDIQPDQQEEWLAQVADWEEALGDLAIVKTAVEQGWSYPPLVAAMQGNITEKGAWEVEAPCYADELAQVRLRILARQGRTQEYIHLAEAEGQVELAINMMAHSGDIEKAIVEAKTCLVYPREMLSLAQVMAAQGEMEAALNVAEHGLSLELLHGKDDLARWAREKAATAGNQALGLKAAQVAFTCSYELADYTAVKQLAGDEWQTIKPELLQKLRQGWSATDKIDIYLHENMLTEAMQALNEDDFGTDYDLHRIIEATRETYPDWGIRKCKHLAEAIMDAGRSGAYDTAVSWLGTVRDIYKQHRRQHEWEAYANHLLAIHHRKYKLVPMLRDICS